ncbi:MAG: 2-oxo acid dehydrogenase subunit E2 [Cypionkella sp.]|nr:2-oxo acid dehydrogenase subunit E2 [Cypionkella sp.]
MAESKFTAPHFYLTIAINMDNAIWTRKKLNELSPAQISFNDLVVKATALALRQHPAINAKSWLGDSIRYNKVYNIGVAVAVEKVWSVPVIRNADTKSLFQISSEVKDKAKKAMGTANYQSTKCRAIRSRFPTWGMFGIEEFTALSSIRLIRVFWQSAVSVKFLW